MIIPIVGSGSREIVLASFPGFYRCRCDGTRFYIIDCACTRYHRHSFGRGLHNSAFSFLLVMSLFLLSYVTVSLELCVSLFLLSYVCHYFSWVMCVTVSLELCVPLFLSSYVCHCFSWVMPLFLLSYVSLFLLSCVTVSLELCHCFSWAVSLFLLTVSLFLLSCVIVSLELCHCFSANISVSIVFLEFLSIPAVSSFLPLNMHHTTYIDRPTYHCCTRATHSSSAFHFFQCNQSSLLHVVAYFTYFIPGAHTYARRNARSVLCIVFTGVSDHPPLEWWQLLGSEGYYWEKP